MQRAEGSSSHAMQPERSGLKPTTAFLLLLLGASATAGVLYLTRPEPAPTPTGTTTSTEPNFALTNEEAIARFEELHVALLMAYRDRDVTFIETFLTTDSPLRDRATSEIRQLLDDKVVARPLFSSRSIRVEENGPSKIVLKQVVVDSSRFESESGENLTKNPKDILRVVRWTLELEGSTWKIYNSDALSSRTL